MVADCRSETRTPPLGAELFRRFCRIAREQAGINLKEGKETLVNARVSKRLRALGLADARSYLKRLECDKTGQEIVHFVDAITTNFTRFFREPEHFRDLGEHVARCARAGQRQFTLWCAAASTGQEPYSVAMALSDLAGPCGIDFRILATDISTRALGVARQGVYADRVVAEVPRGQRRRYFVRLGAADTSEVIWQVRPEVRARVTFDRLNLARPPFPMHGPFDVIFCRNVMIYLHPLARSSLVAEIERLLSSRGLLIVGHAETLTGMRTRLQMVRPSVYVR